jgi:transcriptional regulator with XRE-family HTH domain
MAQWKKRLSDEDARQLGAEIKEAIAASGRNGTGKRIAALAGISASMVHHIASGKSNSTIQTAIKIRNAIRVVGETPDAKLTELPPGGEPGRYAHRSAEQDPLRKRTAEIMKREGLSQVDVAKKAGMHSSSVSSFLKGKTLNPKSEAKLRPALDALGGKASAAPKRTAMVQHRLPLNGLTNGHASVRREQVDVVAARFQTIHEPAPQDAVTAAREALAGMGLMEKGLKAIEALVRIANLNRTGEER